MVSWQPSEYQISDRDIESLENKLEVQFPPDFVEWIKIYQGVSPEGDISIDIKGEEHGFYRLLYVSLPMNIEVDEYSSIESEYSIFVDRCDEFPMELIPFGEDAQNKWYCFDFRNSEKPKIVFVDWEYSYEEEQEDAVKFVADNFTQFLNMLYVFADDK
ncbi:SMI1/KNR4 family protein [Mechercharimyces sp. CAU 1602]|uniref:SMI1/KNR4 family protein n=1 Tax=Mechercharimyces sp. CAU 1602 TaxID=2973933 RepID=UPI00216168EE|nr:SMI1/KNR4 family protein [Mechercharimyces sp. CAU 1602]MCS1351682.1 SMI1/KNR4 family protein [Mechercharimyces sp. CAU 1602]